MCINVRICFGQMQIVLGVVDFQHYVWVVCGVCVCVILCMCCLLRFGVCITAYVGGVCVGCRGRSILWVDYA